MLQTDVWPRCEQVKLPSGVISLLCVQHWVTQAGPQRWGACKSGLSEEQVCLVQVKMQISSGSPKGAGNPCTCLGTKQHVVPQHPLMGRTLTASPARCAVVP